MGLVHLEFPEDEQEREGRRQKLGSGLDENRQDFDPVGTDYLVVVFDHQLDKVREVRELRG